ncbi:hypothetical protein MFIFM68171_03163 [Madurella fahalii]|uniref:Uncharacterized protein n=1 Tax=Madurella fahalii TaxID=1157608 RepID=A0ABQ0G5B3_9PEZI
MSFANQPTIDTVAELDSLAAKYKYLCVCFLPPADASDEWNPQQNEISDFIKPHVSDGTLGFAFVLPSAPELYAIVARFSFEGPQHPGGAIAFTVDGNAETGVDLSGTAQMLQGRVRYASEGGRVRLIQHAPVEDVLMLPSMLGRMARGE